MKDLHIESKVVSIANVDEKIFNFFSDFRNLDRVIPPDVKDWKSEEDSCSFYIKGQNINLEFAEKTPYNTLKISGGQGSPMDFLFWIQLKNTGDYQTAAKLTIKANVNMIMRSALKKPLKQFLDQFAEQMKLIPYN